MPDQWPLVRHEADDYVEAQLRLGAGLDFIEADPGVRWELRLGEVVVGEVYARGQSNERLIYAVRGKGPMFSIHRADRDSLLETEAYVLTRLRWAYGLDPPPSWFNEGDMRLPQDDE